MADNFTEAARAEAERRHQGDWDPFEQEPVDDWGYAETERRAFVAGAEWARTHPAAQEPDDAMVLRALNAYMWEEHKVGPWGSLGSFRTPAVNAMRAVLTAALTEPPARPDGAEQFDAIVDSAIRGHSDITDPAVVRAISDAIAEEMNR